MATACTYCGQDLPRDDAHFCNNCGMLVPSHPFSAQSLAASSSAIPPVRQEPEKPTLREQMVHQPMEKPALREQMVQQPRPRTTRRIAPDNLSASSVAWPAPLTHVSVKESSSQKDDENIIQKRDQAAQNAPSRPISPERELHVKVWEQQHSNPPTPLPESSFEEARDSVEDTPTASLATPEQTNRESIPSQDDTNKHLEDIEHLDTVPVPNYVQTPPPLVPQQAPNSPQSMHGNPPLPVEQQQQRQEPQGYSNTPIPYSNMPPQPAKTSQPSRYLNAQVGRQPAYTNPPQERPVAATTPASVAAARRQKKKSRIPFIILLALIGILVLGSGAWVVLAQPFSIPTITLPLQDFKDTQLGVALSYPSDWSVQRTPTGVLFSDSSHTAQVKLVMTNDPGDAAQYVQQQATKNGMTAIKPLGTRSFAGVSWQQIQGNMEQGGANYTTTLLAAPHGNHIYMLTQMAPQNVYVDEESVVFSAMRNSFKFI